MPKTNILLVETDLQNRRLLEVSLTKAGFSIDVAASEGDALAKCTLHKPDLVISGTELTDSDGFDLCKTIRSRDEIKGVPFLFLTEDASVSSKVRGLELGANDYLVRPIYIKDLISRIEILLANVQRQIVNEGDASNELMRGDLTQISLVEAVQAMAASKKDGTARLDGNGVRGHIWFHKGQVSDASVENLQGEAALFRMFRWESGHFEIDFQTPERLVAIHRPIAELVHEALNQTELWEQLAEQLPPLDTVCTVNFDELADRLDELPDSHTALIRMIDGDRTILEVTRSSNLSDVNALSIFSQLFFEGLVNESGKRESSATAAASNLSINTLADAFVEAVETSDEFLAQTPLETNPIAATAVETVVEETAESTEAIDEPVPTEDQDSPDEAEDAISNGVELEESDEEVPEPEFADDERSFWDLAESTREGNGEEVADNLGFGEENQEEFESMGGATVGDAASEDNFFESQAETTYEDDYEFEEDENRPSGPAKKLALGFIVVFIPLAILIFTKDSVTPKRFSKSVLNDKWAEATVRNLPPIANSVALDAGWTIPNLGDAGILPAPEGTRDTFRETRPKAESEEAEQETPVQAAMEPVKVADKPGPVLEAGNTASPEQKKKAAALNQKGEAALKSESFQQAADMLEKSLALDPSNISALRMNAHVLVELNRMEEAIEFGLKAIRLGAPLEDATELYQLLGQAHQSLGRTQEAKTAYENFLKLAPKSKREETRENAPFIRQLLTTLEQEGPKSADSGD